MAKSLTKTGHKDIRPWVTAVLGAALMIIFFIFQKKLLGGPPFDTYVFFVPVFFGGVAGASVGIIMRRIRTEDQARLDAINLSSAQLQDNKDLFRMLAENATDILFRWNLDKGTYDYISPAVLNITGYSFKDFSDNPRLFLELLFDEDRAIITDIMDDCQNPKPSVEYRLTHKDGRTVWINQRNAVSRDKDGKPIYLEGIATDITEFMLAREEKKQLYQQLNQKQKLESVGRLAGGIAHDFNNLLTIINGYTDLVLEDLDPEDPKYSEIQHIHSASQKASNLTNQLLAFSRDQMVQKQALNLIPVMNEFMTMLQRIIGSGITVEMNLDESLPLVMIDPVHFDQIILNLVINARDAMSHSGHLTLTLTKAIINDEICDHCDEAVNGTFVKLSVSDTGKGIPKDFVKQIFDPFFTTKKAGKGTGLGLATVINLVLKYKGHIQLETIQNVGTTFNVLFPVSTSATISETDGIESSQKPELFGTEHILLVEDEGLIRNLTQTLLEQYGYQVHVAADGESALAIFSEKSQSIDLLFTDIVMPGMNGRELFKQAVALKPSLKILFMSGYSDSIGLNDSTLDRELHFLGKPFNAKTMALKVRKALDAPPPD